jgi:hypothetical protein
LSKNKGSVVILWFLLFVGAMLIFFTLNDFKKPPEAPLTMELVSIKQEIMIESRGFIFQAHNSIPYYFIVARKDKELRTLKIHSSQVISITEGDKDEIVLVSGYTNCPYARYKIKLKTKFL